MERGTFLFSLASSCCSGKNPDAMLQITVLDGAPHRARETNPGLLFPTVRTHKAAKQGAEQAVRTSLAFSQAYLMFDLHVFYFFIRVTNLHVEGFCDPSSLVAKLLVEHTIRLGETHAQKTSERAKKTSSQWAPPISDTITFLTINHYSRLDLRLERTTAAVVGASCKNWLISGTSCRIPFFVEFFLLEHGSDTFFAADQQILSIFEAKFRHNTRS